jgi:hypothetical protein
MLKRLIGPMLAVAAAAGAPAHAEERIALVIGNSQYQAVGWELTNPASDARLIADVLEDLDFRVDLRIDASLVEIEDAFAAHGDRLADAGSDAVGVVYYAGHAIQSQGRNYLLPVDQEIHSEQDVWRKGAQLSLAMEHLQAAGNHTNLIILDACRNNPLPSTARGAPNGLAQSQRTGGVLIAYATAPGQTATDGTGENSPFTQALADLLPTPGLPAELLFKRVGDRVLVLTGRVQQPWYESGLTGEDFCFGGCERLPAGVIAPPPGFIEEPGAPNVEVDPEDLLWEVTQLVGSSESLTIYLDRYPGGRHAAAARRQLEQLAAQSLRTAPNPNDPETLAARVREAQALLGAMGYEPGPLDGQVGMRTAIAVDEFRRNFNLDLSDEIDRAFLEALRGALGEGHRSPSAAPPSTALAAVVPPRQDAVAMIATPIPSGTPIARPTSEDLIGRWCDSRGVRVNGPDQPPAELSVTRNRLTFSWPGGARERYDIATITPNDGTVQVEWRVGQELMVTEFGEFTEDSVTQVRGRRVGDGAWSVYGRVFHRCD